VGELPAGFFQDMSTDAADQLVFFGEGGEGAGRQDATIGMTPADEGFGAGQCPGTERELRLVGQEQLIVLDGPAQFGAQRGPAGAGPVGGAAHVMAVAAGLFRLEHRDVGVADHPLGFDGGIGGHGDAHAAGDGQVPAIVDVGRRDRADDAAADALGTGALVYFGAERDELIASQAGDGIGPAGDAGEPAADLGQDQVAGVMPEGVIDLLEVVQVDE